MSADLEPTFDAGPRRWWWAIPAGGVLLALGILTMFGEQRTNLQRGTSYDASSAGFRAAYLLLEEFGYPVTRSKRPTGGDVRWVLFPTSTEKIEPLKDWLEQGGVVVLACESSDFARELGLDLKIGYTSSVGEQPASGAGIHRLAPGFTTVEASEHPDEVWAELGGKPMVTVYEHGDGQIWLINRPEFLTNENLKKADNGEFLCRLAEELLRRHPGQLAFDEYCHGLRDRPSVTELLLRPPALWVSLQALVLLALLLWYAMPRFGTLRRIAPPARRSKDEFLDAMAALLARKADYNDAYQTARRDLLRELEAELGVSSATSEQVLLLEATHGGHAESLRQVLANERLPGSAGKNAFVNALNDLEDARHEFLKRRNHR